MSTRHFIGIFAFCLAAFGPGLFSQITLEGVVRDNGAEPVENALVELTDQADPGRYFTDVTDKDGRYVIRISETGMDEVRPDIANLFELSQNYPNPFNPSTVIAYEITRPADLRITIHDILGRKIKTLFSGFHSGLSGRIVWDATDDEGRGVPAGIYIYSMNMEGTRLNKKMLLLDGGLGGSGLSQSLQERTAKAPDKKMSYQFLLRVSGTDVEALDRQDVRITGNTVLDVTVYRTVTDVDGHAYRTVKICGQWWMAENLKVTHYRNGEAIPNVADKTAWSALKSGAACEYGNDPVNSSSFGFLYNWYAVNDIRGVAPSGWHVPGDAEWQRLVDCLGGNAIAGGRLKEDGTAHWISPNAGATNESGFSALPGGTRDNEGAFGDMGYRARFWSSTETGSGNAWSYGLNSGGPDAARGDDSKLDGCSIRCIRGFGTVAAPELDPPPGIYTADQMVTIDCSTPGATIHCTTDGSDPTESDSTIGSGASVAITGTMTLKARAYKTDWTASDVAGGVYTITGTVATPTFSPSPEAYASAVDVTISCPDSGATIHYTRNGADPEETDSTYNSPVSISSTVTLKARAFKTDWNPSVVNSGTYTINGMVAAPVFSPSPGTYPSARNITINCPTPGAAIHFTRNGADPEESDSTYRGPVSITSTTTLKARAFKTTWNPSDVDSGTYTITGTVETPVFDPLPGAYPAAQNITITCATPGSAIHFTVNGPNPEESDSTYGSPVVVAGNTTLKARAYRAGWDPSDVAIGTYTLPSTVATPVFVPSPGDYSAAQTITIVCSTPGATLHYTTNGSDPTESSATYRSPVFMPHTAVLKARGYRSGWNPSAVAGGKYTVNTTAVYCMGNSITAAGKYERTLNDLLGFRWGVVNLGVSGQTTAQMLSRFNRDVIAPGDAKYVIVLGGINDIRYGLTAAQIIPNLQSMYTAAHYAGIKVVAVSILPFGNNDRDRGWTPEKQVVLDEVNAWILTTAVYVDYRVNAYKSLEDPANPDCLLPAYDDGDGLHPSFAGYNALANTIYHAVSWTR